MSSWNLLHLLFFMLARILIEFTQILFTWLTADVIEMHVAIEYNWKKIRYWLEEIFLLGCEKLIPYRIKDEFQNGLLLPFFLCSFWLLLYVLYRHSLLSCLLNFSFISDISSFYVASVSWLKLLKCKPCKLI